MAKLPERHNKLANLIDKAYEDRAEPPRPHMGASLLGSECERYLWLQFRWTVVNHFSGRMLRLFERGHDEELRVVKWLRMAGVKIYYTELDGEQKRVVFGCHVSGSMDGVIFEGVPEAPAKKHLFECKTHNLKSFNDLVKQGVQKSKFTHYVQMQIYMHGEGLDRALYVAVCKDDDRIYTERVHYCKKTALKYIERGQRIAVEQYIPPPISTNPAFYKCKMCDFADIICHTNEPKPAINCRTCRNSVAMENGQWWCNEWQCVLETEWQYEGCPKHLFHPDLTQHKPINGGYEIDGKEVRGFSSSEILANPKACAHGDGFTEQVRQVFNAEVKG